MTAQKRARASRRSSNQSMHKEEADSRKAPAAKRIGRVGFAARFNNYLAMHFQVLISTLGQIWRTPLSSLMTTAVIAIALALPAALHVFLGKIESLGAAWQDSAQISLFLKEDVSGQQAHAVKGELQHWPEISTVEYITPEEALEDFRQNSGLGDAMGLLEQNPLPGVLVVYPTLEQRKPDLAQALLEKLRQRPEVDMAQLDMEWIQRLHTIILFADRAVMVLGAALALAVLFVIGNTIRMAIQNRQDEIEVTKLIGGSDAFVRRPFLYNGMWFGLFGGILAWLLVNILLILLEEPVHRLAVLYSSDFTLGLVGMETTFLLLFTGPLLGWLGAWLVTGRRLKSIEPA